MDYKATLKAEVNESRIEQCDALIELLKAAIGRMRTPDGVERMKMRLARCEELKTKIKAELTTPVEEENEPEETLTEKQFKAFRTLTLQEMRVDFVNLSEDFDQMETDLYKDLYGLVVDEFGRIMPIVQKKVDDQDVPWIGALTLLIRGSLKRAIKAKISAAYEKGKTSAVKEISAAQRDNAARAEKANPGSGAKAEKKPLEPTGRPPTIDRQLMAVDAEDIAEGFTTSIEESAKSTAKAGLGSGAATLAIVTAMRAAMEDTARRGIQNISGIVIGQYVNRGRSTVFDDVLDRIVAFERSEILDDRTCAMCMALDKRVVKPDDPMSHMEIVHTNCRGIWIPILRDDEDIPDITGIPKSLTDNFDLVDGRPVVNAFKNLKKPTKAKTSADNNAD